MAVTATDLKIRLSGGSSNTSPNASFGGAMSNTDMGTGAGALFDDVTSAEAAAGAVEYRCVYARNANATDAINGLKIFTNGDSSGAGTTIALGLDPAGVNGTAAAPADAYTAPTGVTFSDATSEINALTVTALTATQRVPFWIRRTTAAGAGPVASDTLDIRLKGTPA